MTKKQASSHDPSVDAQFDAIIAELEPQDVTTDGPAVSISGDQDLLDHLRELGAVEGIGPATLAKVTPADDLVRTARGAIEWARDQVQAHVAIYHGLCLMFVRLCFNVGPTFPDAITAWQQATTRRPCKPDQARRGHAGFFQGGDHGHVVLCLGNGRCISTDVRKPGQASVCLISAIEQAWGYRFLGDVSDLNGERPVPRVKASRPRLSNRAWRLRELRRAISHARAAGNAARARRLREWLTDVQGRS